MHKTAHPQTLNSSHYYKETNYHLSFLNEIERNWENPQCLAVDAKCKSDSNEE